MGRPSPNWPPRDGQRQKATSCVQLMVTSPALGIGRLFCRNSAGAARGHQAPGAFA